ncbi:MAG: ABC transporter permease subunit [Planctomycetes bacterium]|nr:ABC transporter permease subunit [Planctomycetota bacterium]
MNIGLSKSVRYILKPSWLTGPIFDKELRVSSRRRRNYVLRSAYLAILTVFVVLVWHTMVRFQGAAAYRISQMSVAGLAIITTIIMFQFVATQLIAVVMLSTSISDEIYNRTLGVLMTTPINSFQIVMGKLFSKLLQIILLLAISLPLLATVRVFGGVPWNYVISSVCITLTAVIFAGVLSLYFSISARRAYVVILKTLFTLGIIYLFIPIMVVLVSQSFVPTIRQPLMLFSIVMLPNPFVVMQFNTAAMMSPGAVGIMPIPLSWPIHCVVMLGASVFLLAWSMRIVRRVALRQATGQLDLATKNRKKKKLSLKTTKSEGQSGLIRRVKGSPVVWKELRAPIIQGSRKKNIIGLAITIIALLITYAVNMKEKLLDEDFTHIAYTLVFVIIGLITNIVLSATTITTEKETRSWPILLATSMSDWQILIGKAVGVFRRCLPIWLLLAGHLILFITVRYIHPIAVVHLAILVTWIVVFLSGSGLYFSARLKRTTSAVVANFALALTLWAVIPLLLGLVATITYESDILEAYILTNPVVQTVVIMDGAGGSHNATRNLSRLNYEWPSPSGSNWNSIRSTTSILFITMLIYMSMGLLFAWRAKCRFRRNIF